MKRLIVLVVLAMASLAVVAGSASAHNKTITVSCDAGLHVHADSYPSNSTIKVTRDGITLTATTTFSSWDQTYANPAKTAAHNWHVTIVSGDGNHSFDLDQNYTVGACEVITLPPTTVPPVTTVPPTTTTDPGTPPVVHVPAVAVPVVVTPGFTG